MSRLPDGKIDRLRSLLEEEVELLVKIGELTDRQTNLVAEDRIEELNESLDRRQAIIDKFDRLHQESDVLMQSYVSVPPASYGDRAAAIEELRTKIRGIISSVAEKNNNNISQAKQVLEQYSEQGNKLDMSRKSIGLYAQGAVYSGDYFDKTT